MPLLIQIAILIAVVIICVHFVYEKGKKAGEEVAFERGKAVGIAIGRIQILEENLLRDELISNRDYQEIERIVS